MAPLIFCLLAAALAEDLTTAPPQSEQASFEGSQVLTIFAENRPDIEKIVEEENIDIWAENKTHMDIFLPGEKVDVLKGKFSANQINFSIKINDVDAAIREQNPPPSEEDEELDGRKGHKMNWDKYQRLDVIYGYMDYLAQTYPNLVTTGVIGNSYENRPIKYIRISSGKPNPNVFVIDGGIHAREWISPATTAYIIRELVENRGSLPADLQEVEFYIVPVVNPDGYEYTHIGNRLWRKNKSRSYVTCSGTDLNRNFAHSWGGKGTSGNPCSEIYRGRSALSENESRALANFIQGLRNVKAYVTFHSYGQFILIPYGYDYNAFPPDFKEMERVAIRASHAMARSGGQHYTVGNTAHTLYPASGGSDDWVKAQTGATYVYTIELRDKGNYGFTLPARQILPTAKEAYEAVKVIAAAAARS
ncbi:carboxypeptidase B [Halyomorpha halys]|uniref:carboxypeptidase B n=1 Tax=Halyomorpha halys TaxID=286706 RepID=UPI0006D4F4FA|nr:carboxypeptidase B-like [Halyomorpha halys]